MAKILHDIVRIKAIPITQVVEKFADVKPKGALYVTKCIWHDDDDPSLHLYYRTGENHAYCFACNKYASNIDYVMASQGVNFPEACEIISGMFGIPTLEGDNIRRNFTPIVKKQPAKEKKPVAYIPMDKVEDMLSMDNAFCKCMVTVFGYERAKFVADEYMLGTYEYWDGSIGVTFPTIDTEGRVRNIKVQKYCADINSERFFHTEKDGTIWLFSIMQKHGEMPKETTYDNDCLFGAHLLPKYPAASVIIVESPKNALIGACACPQYVWVATGNKNQLKRPVLECLRGRNVMVYPDRDAIEEWRKLLSTMSDITEFHVDDFCETMAPPGEEKYDIADFIIDAKMKSK